MALSTTQRSILIGATCGIVLAAALFVVLLSAAQEDRNKTMYKVVEITMTGRQECETRLDAYKVTLDKVVKANNKLRADLRVASKDRDVAFLILEDVRIAIGAVAATQNGRFKQPYIKPRKRP